MRLCGLGCAGGGRDAQGTGATALARVMPAAGAVWAARGARGRTEGAVGAGPPRALCAAGLLPILHQELIVLPLLEGAVGARLLPIAMALAALTLAVRGLAGCVPAWRRNMSGEPFATIDVRYYSPLCLAIGVGFGILLL